MKIPKIKKTFLAIIVVVAVMMILNPSVRRFKDFAADVNIKNQRYVLKRTQNWLLFSIYKKELHSYNSDIEAMDILSSETYLGIFLNFANITPRPVENNEVVQIDKEDKDASSFADTTLSINSSNDFGKHIDSLRKIKGYKIDLLKESATFHNR